MAKYLQQAADFLKYVSKYRFKGAFRGWKKCCEKGDSVPSHAVKTN